MSSLPRLAILATGLCLQAEPPRLGVQGLVNVPLSDLKTYVDGKAGPGFGIHGTFDLNDGHVLRPRLDYSVHPQASFTTTKQSASSFSLGGDYLYFIAGRTQRIYLTCGLAVVRWSFEHTDPIAKTTTHTTKIGVAGGLGYQWNAALGTEVRWLRSKTSSTFKADTLQGGVTLRF